MIYKPYEELLEVRTIPRAEKVIDEERVKRATCRASRTVPSEQGLYGYECSQCVRVLMPWLNDGPEKEEVSVVPRTA